MSDLNENTAKRYPLNISEKQVSKPREHTGGKTDIKTGKPMMMRKIYIPSQEYRPKDVDLRVDSNGIDRNERKGYINVPDRHIFVDKKREGRLYTYLSDDRKVKINFSGEKTGRIKNGKPQYDSPEPLEMSAKDFVHLYDGIAREKNKDKTVTKNKTKEINKDKASPER